MKPLNQTLEGELKHGGAQAKRDLKEKQVQLLESLGDLSKYAVGGSDASSPGIVR